MIDWTSNIFPCLHVPLPSGRVTSISPDGEVEWVSMKSLSVVGSYDSNLRVKSCGGNGEGLATHLFMDGNPSKFLQGHNLFGSNDLLSLNSECFDIITKRLSIIPSAVDRDLVYSGAYAVARIDINESFSLPSRSDVRAWIRAAEFKSRTRQGRPAMKGGTLYFGKNSRRHSFKFYCKADEIEVKGRELPLPLQGSSLSSWVEDKLRAELCLRSLELKRLGLSMAASLTPTVLSELFYKYLGTIDMNEQFSLSSEQLFNLPNKLRTTYSCWLHGDDLRSMLPKVTFYRHRKFLLDFGIDITIRREVETRSNVVPLIRVLEAVPASIPDFAFEQGLVHSSARRA